MDSATYHSQNLGGRKDLRNSHLTDKKPKWQGLPWVTTKIATSIILEPESPDSQSNSLYLGHGE